MNIIIAGSGNVGRYLAKKLVKEGHDIVVIDTNKEILKEVESSYDLISLYGSCTSFSVLKEAGVANCDLFIAVTNSEDSNVLACVFAKKFGAKKTVARIDNMEYLSPVNKLSFINLGIDRLIYPEYIAAQEVVGVIKQTGTTEIFEFSGGKLTMFVIKVDESSPLRNLMLKNFATLTDLRDFRIAAITREFETIIPNGETIIQTNDYIYIITLPEIMQDLLSAIGISKLELHNIMILGGSRIGIRTSKFLESQLNIKLFEIDPEKSKKLVDMLPNTMVINSDGRNIDNLLDEGLENTDVFTAVTGDDETNILTCLMAKRYGVKKVIAEIENMDYIDVASRMGIDTIINKKLSTASMIYALTMKAEVAMIKCLTGTKAEVLEFVVSKDAVVTKNQLKDIKFPQGIIIGGIVRGNKSFIAMGDTQIRQGDNVVLFALPDAIGKISKYF